METRVDSIDQLTAEIVACRACPRLVAWREQVAREKRASFRDWDYWGKPVPGWGDPAARVVIVGLAPAAHGGNRTGRVFTGDNSGDWLYGALHRAGFANQASATHVDDGLRLTGAYILATVRCAPPENKPTIEERDRCEPFFAREISLLTEARVLVALGKYGWDAVSRLFDVRPRPVFGHEREAALPGGQVLLGSYHPSQHNTFTGRLTVPMFDSVFARARALANA